MDETLTSFCTDYFAGVWSNAVVLVFEEVTEVRHGFGFEITEVCSMTEDTAGVTDFMCDVIDEIISWSSAGPSGHTEKSYVTMTSTAGDSFTFGCG